LLIFINNEHFVNAVTITAISALQVFLNVMRYINPRFTYLLTCQNGKGVACGQNAKNADAASLFGMKFYVDMKRE